MPMSHARKAFFSLADHSGVVRNLSSFLNSQDINIGSDNADTSGFGTDWATALPGMKNATIKLSGLSGFAAGEPNEVLFNLVGGGVNGTACPAFVFGPAGSASGSVKYSGSGWVMSFNEQDALADAVKFNSDFTIEGSVVRGTF